jgi:hypothetical protein
MAPPRPAIAAVCLERSLVLRLIAQDLASDARDKRGLAFAAPLVGRAKPVPAFQLVGVAALCRTDHEARLFSSLRTSTRALRDKARALQRPFPAALFGSSRPASRMTPAISFGRKCHDVPGRPGASRLEVLLVRRGGNSDTTRIRPPRFE